MVKVVINICYGGFGLSYKAVMRYAEIKGFKLYAFVSDDSPNNTTDKRFVPYEEYTDGFLVNYAKKPLENGQYDSDSCFFPDNIERDDPALIQVIEELGELANDRFAELKIVEVPDDVEWTVGEHDGNEWIAERHRRWC